MRQAPDETRSAPQPQPAAACFTTNSTVDDYLEYAFKHNSALKAADARAKAAAERAGQAGYLADPVLSYEHMVEKHDMQYRVGLAQAIPGFGKRRLRKEVAGFEADAVQHDSESMRLMVFERLVATFYEYHYLGRSLAVTRNHVSLLADLEDVLLTRFKTKKARYTDVLKLQVERDSLENRLAALKEMRPVMSGKLAALLDLPVETLFPWPRVAPSGDTVLSGEVLRDMLEMLNPELRALAARIDSLSSAEALAGRSRLPDFVIGAGYHRMPEQQDGSEPEDYGLTMGISLPLWWGKYGAAAREARLAKEAALNARKQMEVDLQVELEAALFDLRDAQRQIELLNTSLIPKARQAFEVAQSEFATGEAGFMSLIDAQRTLLDLSLKLERARADREIALGEIGCCVGKYDVKALGMNAAGTRDEKEKQP
jgi:outer membrane protein TolC